MNRKRMRCVCASVVGAVLLTGAWGCTPWPFISSEAVSFGLGWLARGLGLGTVTQTACFRNGILIDCSELPPDVQAAEP